MKEIRVLVVDDSALSRRSISNMLEGMSGVRVVGTAIDGEEGIRQAITLKPDLVTLDLEMPRMDGFTLLRILTTKFHIPVIVVSALSQADKVFKALELGALDFVPKPSGDPFSGLALIREDLQFKVRQASNARVLPGSAEKERQNRLSPMPKSTSCYRGKKPAGIVAIASSTGGPPALQSIFSTFEQSYQFAIVIAQHMPSGFTTAFAERLNRSTAFEVREATDGDIVKPGLALLAPGGFNMILNETSGLVKVNIVPPPPDKRYIPSADELLTSCARIYGDRALAVVLTGMGNDGSAGVRAVKAAGGRVIAESENSSVVYGMPREAFATGCVDVVADLDDIPQEILALGGFNKPAAGNKL